MMRYTVRPISDRTPFTGQHVLSPFRASWDDTLDLLAAELDHLAATDVVLELDVAEGNVRVDGMLRADARVASPAVRIAFGSKHGPLAYATDRYFGRGRGWQQNVRAIALGLEALRKLDRYGITRAAEQYAGWKALPPGTGTAPTGGMTHTGARALLAAAAGGRLPVSSDREVWKAARAATHPDRWAGDRSRWDQVEEAARALGLTQ